MQIRSINTCLKKKKKKRKEYGRGRYKNMNSIKAKKVSKKK